MELTDKQLEQLLDEVLDDVSLTAQSSDINANRAIIGKELLESDKKRWSLFRIGISVALLLLTTIGYVYYGGLHSDLHTNTVKVAIIEDNAKDYVTKKDLLECTEKRFTALETQIKSLPTQKDLSDIKNEILSYIFKIHIRPSNADKEKGN